jgi:branched-chain amino acid transport system permease protein
MLLAPAVMPPYAVIVLSYALALAIACLGLNLLLGHTGLLSLGHATYFGAGAYAGGLLVMFTPMEAFELYMAAGMVAATLLAAVFGVICVRATGVHFTILTLASAQIVHSLFISGVAFRRFGGFGRGLFLSGGGGLYLPRFTMASVELSPGVFPVALYYVSAALFVVSAFLMWRIVHSPLGLALCAIRDSETRAAFMRSRFAVIAGTRSSFPGPSPASPAASGARSGVR